MSLLPQTGDIYLILLEWLQSNNNPWPARRRVFGAVPRTRPWLIQFSPLLVPAVPTTLSTTRAPTASHEDWSNGAIGPATR